MYAQPQAGDGAGELVIHTGPAQFAEFFPDVTEEHAIDALGSDQDGTGLTGTALRERLDQIERFLTSMIKLPDANGGQGRSK